MEEADWTLSIISVYLYVSMSTVHKISLRRPKINQAATLFSMASSGRQTKGDLETIIDQPLKGRQGTNLCTC